MTDHAELLRELDTHCCSADDLFDRAAAAIRELVRERESIRLLVDVADTQADLGRHVAILRTRYEAAAPKAAALDALEAALRADHVVPIGWVPVDPESGNGGYWLVNCKPYYTNLASAIRTALERARG